MSKVNDERNQITKNCINVFELQISGSADVISLSDTLILPSFRHAVNLLCVFLCFDFLTLLTQKNSAFNLLAAGTVNLLPGL